MTLAPARTAAVRRRQPSCIATVVAALTVAGLGPLPQASAAIPAPTLSYVGSASTARSGTSHQLRIPATIAAGDTLLLFVTTNSRSGHADRSRPAGP